MKAQLSLELMLYAALAGLAMLFAIGVVSKSSAAADSLVDRYEVSYIVDEIGTALAAGASTSGFSAYVPQGLCGAELSGGVLQTVYGNFSVPAMVTLSNGVFCPAGEYARFSVSWANATPALVRT